MDGWIALLNGTPVQDAHARVIVWGSRTAAMDFMQDFAQPSVVQELITFERVQESSSLSVS